jgi:dimethylhistidine N-methyltransferase
MSYAAEQAFGSTGESARAEITAGLEKAQAVISPKYFYDSLGSKLFEAICQLEEYYLTRAEAEIFRDHGAEIAQAAGEGAALIDLGAGNCEKAAGLFEVLRPLAYVPVDISVEFLLGAVEKLRQKHPGIAMHPVGLDFSESLNLPESVRRRSKKLFFYPGSSLGNFTPLQAVQFLRRMREHDAAVLLGVDLVKGPAVLEAAYDDALGVTAAFNLNVLLHVNRILGSDFKVKDWAHRAVFNSAQSRVEMHLVARRDARVGWAGGSRWFAAGEHIHTENSYKYSRPAVAEMLLAAGFGGVQSWMDEEQRFMVCYARPV